MKREIVQYKNELNTIGLKKFTATEQDLFMALCYKAKHKGREDVVFTFDELRELSDYSATSTEKLVKDMKLMNGKLNKLSVNFDDGSKYVSFVLFPEFEIDRDTRTVTIQVGRKFDFLLNNFGVGEKWTGFELAMHAKLESKYSKTMFRLLKQWRTQGKKNWSLEKFRELLDVPESYDMRNITLKVLKPILKELGEPGKDGTPPLFNNLTVVKHRKGVTKPVTSLTFSFERETTESIWEFETDEKEEYGNKTKPGTEYGKTPGKETGKGAGKEHRTKAGEGHGRKTGKNTVKKGKTENLPEWVGETGTETPLSPEDSTMLNKRIAGLKTTRTKKE